MIFTGIKEKRIEQGLTQKQLGELVGVDQTAVHLWETGKALPRAKMLIKLSEELNCSVDELLAE